MSKIKRKSKTKGYIISLIITLIIGAISYYFLLPPINLQSFEFYEFVLGLLVVFTISSIILTCKTVVTKNKIELDETSLPKFYKYEFLVVFVVMISIVIADIILSPIFNANSYSKRITIDESGEFTKDIKPVNFSQLPLLDKSSSQKLGDRVMGQMPELVSQFYVSDLYTQINYNDKIVRVTPLEYADIIKYFSNRKDGVAGYITVDSVDGSAKLVKLDKGMKYMPSALFNDNLKRHVRFKYPTEILGDYQFEIDNDGNPYWIVTTIKYTGINLKKEISGVIIVDPITGDMKKYKVKDVPNWVDHVYSAGLIINQVNDWGSYRGGFLNSIFGQKNVVQTTEGYNYTVMNDDVYLYTGITSAVSDESNLGFILTNMRTKETKFYAVPGAEEYSAMSSAEGQVQQMQYESTFPLLINLNNKPTYLVSLKDDAGLVKMYAFVDVADYQKVVVTDASKGIEEAAKNYLGADIETGEEEIEKEIVIEEINTATIDGTTYYYIVDDKNTKYKISIKVEKNKLPFIKKGDKLTIYYKTVNDVINVTKIK